MRIVAALGMLALSAGCATTSKVEYRVITSPADMKGMTDAFYMRRSVLELSASNVPAGKTDVETTIAIQALPREAQSLRIGVAAHRGFLSTTKINITKVENTDLVKSIGVETTDETVNRINQIGGVAVKLIQSAAMLGLGNISCLSPADGKQIFELNPTNGSETFKTVRGNCITVTYGPLPKEVIRVQDLPKNTATSLYYYSACRDADVVIQQTDDVVRREKIRVSDPAYLQYVEFPLKGKIEHHSQCGVSVTTEAYTATNPADIVGALTAQGKAIKDALEAAKKDEAK
ncbi:hypothetical protein [Sphingobium yanoikuyae]|uniref:hypothetical protein n=1 Tax=Sphingobium yanoikuyae TaxID=13690 RepID=UPI0024204B68|nr:hypothetical protein [Sphingobium yanoikuyae]